MYEKLNIKFFIQIKLLFMIMQNFYFYQFFLVLKKSSNLD
jgi:hypothetical protein